MTVRHVPEHRDEGTQQRRFSSGSILALHRRRAGGQQSTDDH